MANVAFISGTVIGSSLISGSQNITVPADATFVIGIVGGFHSNFNWLGTNPMSLGGVNFTEIQRFESSSSSLHQFQGRIVSPTTGTQALAWSLNTAFQSGGQIGVAFFKFVDTVAPVKDFGSGSTSVTGLTFATGDMICGSAVTFTPTLVTVTTSGQTEIWNTGFTNNTASGMAYKASVGDFNTTSGSFMSVMAAVIAQSTGGGGSVQITNSVGSGWSMARNGGGIAG